MTNGNRKAEEILFPLDAPENNNESSQNEFLITNSLAFTNFRNWASLKILQLSQNTFDVTEKVFQLVLAIEKYNVEQKLLGNLSSHKSCADLISPF